MNTSLDHIAAYFEEQLSTADREAFEAQCVTDPEFAEEVAAYVAMRDAIRKNKYEQKKRGFEKLYAELSQVPVSEEWSNDLKEFDRQLEFSKDAETKESFRNSAVLENEGSFGSKESLERLSVTKDHTNAVIRKLVAYMAAACILLMLGWVFLFKSQNSRVLSENYITANFNTLGLNMSGNEGEDQLQKGIAAFNDKRYQEAAQIFETLIGPENKRLEAANEFEAVKDLGITYLVTGKYDEAIAQFDRLSKYTVHVNPGVFYKALVLMRRSGAGDKANAKKLLQRVVDQQLSGSKAAEHWLKKL